MRLFILLTHRGLFRTTLSVNYRNVIKIVKAVFEKIDILLLGHITRAPIFGVRTYIFIQHGLIAEKLLNTK
jgi:hypothetical protein